MHSLFFFLAGVTWYYQDIYTVFTYFTSFTGCKDDIFELISKLYFQRSQFWGKIYKFEEKKYFQKLNSVVFVGFVLAMSVYNTTVKLPAQQKPAAHYTALYNTAVHCTTLHNTEVHCTALQNNVLPCTELNTTAVHYTALCNTTVYFTAMYFTALDCTFLLYPALHGSLQFRSTLHHIAG